MVVKEPNRIWILAPKTSLIDAGQHRGQRHQQDPDGTERVGVALQHARLADQDEHRDEAPDADGREDDLQVGLRRADRGSRWPGSLGHSRNVITMPQAVQQGREREQQRVRPRGEPPHGQVREQYDGHVRRQVQDDPRGQLAVKAEADVGEGERDQREGEHEHDQLGAPPAAGHRSQRTRRVNGWRRGGDATHEAPVAGTRSLAAMPNAAAGGHMPRPGQLGPGLAMPFVGLCCFLASATRGLVGVVPAHPGLQCGVGLLACG